MSSETLSIYCIWHHLRVHMLGISSQLGRHDRGRLVLSYTDVADRFKADDEVDDGWELGTPRWVVEDGSGAG